MQIMDCFNGVDTERIEEETGYSLADFKHAYFRCFYMKLGTAVAALTPEGRVDQTVKKLDSRYTVGAIGLIHVSPSYIPPNAEESDKIASVIAVLAISGLANRYTLNMCRCQSAWVHVDNDRNFVQSCNDYRSLGPGGQGEESLVRTRQACVKL
jgi:hypothetical protein